MNRYDIPTKHGSIGLGIEIISADRVDDYDTLDFAVTISLPRGFRESDTRITRKGETIQLELDTSREIPPDDRR